MGDFVVDCTGCEGRLGEGLSRDEAIEIRRKHQMETDHGDVTWHRTKPQGDVWFEL